MTSAFGLHGHHARIVQVLEELLYVPNAPRMKDGMMSVLAQRAWRSGAGTRRLFDRWGGTVRSDDPSRWDGEDYDAGVYAVSDTLQRLGSSAKGDRRSITLVR